MFVLAVLVLMAIEHISCNVATKSSGIPPVITDNNLDCMTWSSMYVPVHRKKQWRQMKVANNG